MSLRSSRLPISSKGHQRFTGYPKSLCNMSSVTDTLKKDMLDGVDVNDPCGASKLQCIVITFFDLLRKGQLRPSQHQDLVDTFCGLIDQDDHWSLAQAVASDLRTRPQEKSIWIDPSKHVRLNFTRNPATEQADVFVAEDITGRLKRIPRRNEDRTMMVEEAHVAAQRHLLHLEYLITGGNTKDEATEAEAEEIRKRYHIAERKIRKERVGCPPDEDLTMKDADTE